MSTLDVPRDGDAELTGMVAAPDDHAGGAEAEIRDIATRAPPVARPAHDLVALFGDGLLAWLLTAAL